MIGVRRHVFPALDSEVRRSDCALRLNLTIQKTCQVSMLLFYIYMLNQILLYSPEFGEINDCLSQILRIRWKNHCRIS
jgi:hypothetical protein